MSFPTDVLGGLLIFWGGFFEIPRRFVFGLGIRAFYIGFLVDELSLLHTFKSLLLKKASTSKVLFSLPVSVSILLSISLVLNRDCLWFWSLREVLSGGDLCFL